jgi:hypothetical protein
MQIYIKNKRSQNLALASYIIIFSLTAGNCRLRTFGIYEICSCSSTILFSFSLYNEVPDPDIESDEGGQHAHARNAATDGRNSEQGQQPGAGYRQAKACRGRLY